MFLDVFLPLLQQKSKYANLTISKDIVIPKHVPSVSVFKKKLLKSYNVSINSCLEANKISKLSNQREDFLYWLHPPRSRNTFDIKHLHR